VAATKRKLGNKYLRKRAMAAASTLLGIAPAAQAAEKITTNDPWTFDTSFTRYSEAERITVLEPQISTKRDFSDNRSLSILVTVDSITGATPLGTLPATANTAPNTITSPSGHATNPIVGKIPLSHMTDTRFAMDTTWEQPLAPNYSGAFGINASKETDYIATGINSKIARDFNQKNTTLSIGIAPEIDVNDPNGGLPIAYAVPYVPGSIDGRRDTKWIISGLLGVTQTINRRLLMQFNYGLTTEHGYLNDPYKLLSLINEGGDPISAIYEKRPRERIEHSFYWLTRYNIWAKDVLGLALRYYSDDWGIRSQTLDFTFHRQRNDHFYWEPHVRYYHQSAADFYRLGLLTNQSLPEFASADLRLAEFNAVTFGLGFGYTLKNGTLLIARAEYYTQSGENRPREAVGAQKSFDLFPTLHAVILQLDYQFSPEKLWSRKK